LARNKLDFHTAPVWCDEISPSKISGSEYKESTMHPMLSKAALPLTLVILMIIGAWASFLSVAVSSLF
jgi:hypothetical protein